MSNTAIVPLEEAPGRGSVMAGIRDVASLAGVSAATVSRVLTSDTRFRVRAETRERVLVAARQLGISERTLRYRLASFRDAGLAVAGARR